jgi:oxidase EvaA
MISKKKKSEIYHDSFKKYEKFVKSFEIANVYKNTIESAFEVLKDWSLFYSLEEVREWFLQKRKNTFFKVEEIALNETNNWVKNGVTGNIFHKSKDFFIIHGVRVRTNSREISNGWDQPIIQQVGYDGGILGVIRQRFNGVPHYLCEAKMEPGNYGKVQLSPTIQATFANIKKVHKGRKPYFIDYFENAKIYKFEILFDAWLAEDGGRFFLKRNRGMLIEVSENFKIDLPNDNFIWLSLYQIKQLLRENAWVNPHIRSILCHV